MPQQINFSTVELVGLEVLKRKLNYQFSPPHPICLVLRSEFNPGAPGVDVVEIPVPYAVNGVDILTFNVSRITLRVGTAGGQPSIRIQKSVDAGVFNPVTVGDITLALGAYQGSESTGLGTVNSGDKLRVNVLAIGTATYWTITVELAQTYG